MKGIFICPNCGAFVNPDDEMCLECDEDITLYDEGELESETDPVVVYSSETLAEAQAIVEFLRDNDITSTYVDLDSPARAFLSGVSSDSIAVVVLSKDVIKAEELVDEYFAFVSDGDEEDKEWSDDDFEAEEDGELDEDTGSNHLG